MLEWWVNNSATRNTFLFKEKEKPKIFEQGSFGKALLGWMEDDNPLNRTPIATIVLIILNVIGFFVLSITDAQNQAYMFTPALFLNDPGKVKRICLHWERAERYREYWVRICFCTRR
jgi:hypothetical protein